MKKGDISEMIQKLKAGREETPNVASITSAPAKKFKSEVESIHKAKELEFPLEIASEKAPKKAVKKAVASVAVKKVKAEAAPPAKAGKGSEEMKAKMAAIRAKKGKKE
jgi:vacuolar-type H+-ATPase subunit F/Vma7